MQMPVSVSRNMQGAPIITQFLYLSLRHETQLSFLELSLMKNLVEMLEYRVTHTHTCVSVTFDLLKVYFS